MSIGAETLKREDMAFMRERAQAFVQQIRTDERVRQQVVSDPASTLHAFGFQEGKRLWEASTSYSEAVDDCCNDLTCFTSACPSTCNVSLCDSTFID